MAATSLSDDHACPLNAGGFLSSLLFDVTPTDAGTFALAVLVLVAVALVAAYLPARHAAAIDPVAALRAE